MSYKEERFYFLAFVLSNEEQQQKKRYRRWGGEEPGFCKMFLSAFSGWLTFHRAM